MELAAKVDRVVGEEKWTALRDHEPYRGIPSGAEGREEKEEEAKMRRRREKEKDHCSG